MAARASKSCPSLTSAWPPPGRRSFFVRTIEAIRETDASANAHTAVLAGEGLLSLLGGRADEAVEQLEAAVERERELGHTYDASCLELDLALACSRPLGQEAAAQKAHARAAAVLEPLALRESVLEGSQRWRNSKGRA